MCEVRTAEYFVQTLGFTGWPIPLCHGRGTEHDHRPVHCHKNGEGAWLAVVERAQELWARVRDAELVVLQR